MSEARELSLLLPPASAPSYPDAWTKPCISVGPVRPIIGIAVRPVVRPIIGITVVGPVVRPIIGIAVVGPVVRPIIGIAVIGPVVRPIVGIAVVRPIHVVPVSVVPIAPGFRRRRGEEGCGRGDARRRA
jgi:hypothetical protein